MKNFLRSNYVWITFVILLAAGLRSLVLYKTGCGIEADEAVVGLMARHILEGRPWPVFYYGQPYMGSLEPTLAAGVFSLFGQSNCALKIVPLLFSLLHVYLVYRLARVAGGEGAARMASFLTAVAPNGLMVWSSKARGGFIELVVIGTLSLLVATVIISSRAQATGRSYFGLGVLLGLGWWVNNQIIFYLLAIGLTFGVAQLGVLGWRRFLRYGVLGGVGFLLGGLPFWYYNLFEQPRFSSFHFLLRETAPRDFLVHLRGMYVVALPMLVGAKRFWGRDDIFGGATALALTYYAVVFCVGVTLLVCRWWVKRSSGEEGAERVGVLGLLLVFPMVTAVVFAASSFGWFADEPRYLLPLYSVVFVIVGVVAEAIGRGLYPVARGLALVVVVGIPLGFNLASNYHGGIRVPGEPIVYHYQRVAVDQRPLYEWLRRNNYRQIFTNYWIGYRTAFETGEEITFLRYPRQQPLRIAEYETLSPEERGFVPYVLVSEQAPQLKNTLAALGYLFRETAVGGYVVIDQVRPELEIGAPLVLSASWVKATSRSSWVPQLVDGNRGSRWGSGRPQEPGMAVTVELPLPQKISALYLEQGLFQSDYARGLMVTATPHGGAGEECLLFDGPLVTELDQSWKLVVNPQLTVQQLRFEQTGRDPVFDWSIAELELFGPAISAK